MLRRAVDYALTAVDTVTSDVLSQPTPCSKWSLRMLLSHACESVAAFQQGLASGRVRLFPTEDDDTASDLTCCLRVRLTQLCDEWTATSDGRTIAVADHRIPQSLVAAAAALEIGVHGWDVFQASGHHRPIPPDLAARLLAISPSCSLPTTVTRCSRHRFALARRTTPACNSSRSSDARRPPRVRPERTHHDHDRHRGNERVSSSGVRAHIRVSRCSAPARRPSRRGRCRSRHRRRPRSGRVPAPR